MEEFDSVVDGHELGEHRLGRMQNGLASATAYPTA